LSTIPSISTKLATTSHLKSISRKDHRWKFCSWLETVTKI